MFGRAQRRAKQGASGATATAQASAKPAKLHSIAAMMRGRSFNGGFDFGGISYSFTYSPVSAAAAGGKLQLTGNLTVLDPKVRASRHDLGNVRATLLAAQGGIGTAPPRQKLPAEISTSRPDLPIVESTGSLSFCGVLYFKLAPMNGPALGVPADMGQVQLNVRLAPVSDAERGLQAAFSSITDSLYGERVDRSSADAAVSELNKLLAG